jgi:hypothetical protein
MGSGHTHTHRMCFGTLLILLGVSLTQIEIHGVAKFFCDTCGFSMHGLGFTPFIELFQKNGEDVTHEDGK